MILQEVTEIDREVLDELTQGYMAEMANYTDDVLPVNGRYEYPYFEFYFTDPDRTAHIVYQEDQPVGFVMIRRENDPENGEPVMEVAEFYVIEAERRTGLGSQLALKVWQERIGRWQLGVLKDNQAAYSFWRSLIAGVDQDFVESPPTLATNHMWRFEFTIR